MLFSTLLYIRRRERTKRFVWVQSAPTKHHRRSTNLDVQLDRSQLCRRARTGHPRARPQEFVWQSCAFLCFPPLSSSSALSPRRRASRLCQWFAEWSPISVSPNRRLLGRKEKKDELLLLLLLPRRRRVFFSGGARQSAGERARVLPLPPRKPFKFWFFLAHYSCRPARWEEDFGIHLSLSLSRRAREPRGVHLSLRCGA
jgi:hypothetical protein